MLSKHEAKKIGIRACIDKLGYEFCRQHADNSVSAYGEEDGIMNCFVGVSDEPAPDYDISKVDELILSPGNDWPYYASCNVTMKEGIIEFLECKIPLNVSV